VETYNVDYLGVCWVWADKNTQIFMGFEFGWVFGYPTHTHTHNSRKTGYSTHLWVWVSFKYPVFPGFMGMGWVTSFSGFMGMDMG
jgi:hypothetical protein